MACKYLSTFRIAACVASDELLIPSLFELNEFCNNRFEECPIYQRAQGEPKKEMHVARSEEKQDQILKIV
jgi:hypothetical protein